MKSQVYNPYLPCFEYIPDGEPRIFGGRLYIFGSHDRFGGSWFCENDYVTWSAPVDDLSDWRFEGVIYTKAQDPRPGNLYAPDVVQGIDGRYYLYYSKADTSVISVAVCDSPAGKYEYLGDVSYPDGSILGEGDSEYFQFDPSVLVDGGRAWLYSGSGQYGKQHRVRQQMVGCMAIELEPDMVTVKSRPRVILPGAADRRTKAFFEGASARKIGELYYIVFPACDMTGLNYAVSRYPDRDFVIRGVVHCSSDIGIGRSTVRRPAYPVGNSHGGLVCVQGQWYIFDHRMTNRNSFSRQGVAEPVFISTDGTVSRAESTSCGLNGGPLRGEGTYPACIACNLMRGAFSRISPYVTQDKPDDDPAAVQYVSGIGRGCIAGYKYFLFDTDKVTLTVSCRCNGKGALLIYASNGTRRYSAGRIKVKKSADWQEYSCVMHISPGENALFFSYSGSASLDLLEFSFSRC